MFIQDLLEDRQPTAHNLDHLGGSSRRVGMWEHVGMQRSGNDYERLNDHLGQG